MTEGVLIAEEVFSSFERKKMKRKSKIKLLTIAIFISLIMLLVSLQTWIVDDVVDEIKKDLGIYERVPVWERSEWPYLTDQSYSFVMENGEYSILETDNEWN